MPDTMILKPRTETLNNENINPLKTFVQISLPVIQDFISYNFGLNIGNFTCGDCGPDVEVLPDEEIQKIIGEK